MNTQSEIQQLKTQVQELNRKFENLNRSQSIPLEMVKSLAGRGFVTSEFFVAGTGTYNVSGEYTLVIPNATANSIVQTTDISVSATPTIATIRPSVTSVGQYELFAEGDAGKEFSFVVFLFKSKYVS